MSSSCAGFSVCRIQFMPEDPQRARRDYSNRSLLELRQYDFGDYTIRALDIENNKQIIFEIRLKTGDQYVRGETETDPDEIRDATGIYYLWLNKPSRHNFHEALDAAFTEIQVMSHESPRSSPTKSTSNTRDDRDAIRSHTRDGRDSPKFNTRDDRDSLRSGTRDGRDPHTSNTRDDRDPPRFGTRDDRDAPKFTTRDDRDSLRSGTRDGRDSRTSNTRDDRDPPSSGTRDDRDAPRSSTHKDRDPDRSSIRDNRDLPSINPRHGQDQRRSTEQTDEIDLLTDVYQLSRHISHGRVDDAVQLVKQLSKQGVRLEASLQDRLVGEKSIQVRVKIDSTDRQLVNQNDELTMNVYPSTTIAELRAAFGYSKKFPAENQYFFVNGLLAHDKSKMMDLDIHHDTLFVLLVIQ